MSLQRYSAGFNLIEIVVVLSIIITMSVVLIVNFGSINNNKNAQNQSAAVIASDIRRLQSAALSGKKFQSKDVCGYGVHYVDPNSYVLYVISDLNTPGCADESRLYADNASALDLEQRGIQNPNLEFRAPFDDIYFEIPFARTYINNRADNGVSTDVIIAKKDRDCLSDTCTTITMTTAGAINSN